MKRMFLVLIAFVQLASTAYAKENLELLRENFKQAAAPTFDLNNEKGQTFYDLVHDKIGPAMEEAGRSGSDNEKTLRAGGGVSVKLDKNNYNIHINYPASEMGGRSYGWTSDETGDWSDSAYLKNIAELMDGRKQKEIRNFYQVVLNILGSSNPDGLGDLSTETQLLANNFLAIYTAEEYRRTQNENTRWDDALLQVTLLAAFHGGQDVFEMFYTGKFTKTTKRKNPGVYANGRPGPLANSAANKPADMQDYHQFSRKTPDMQGANRSGINLVRADFQKLGRAITEYLDESKNLAAIRKILKASKARVSNNVISDIAVYYAEGDAKAKDSAAMANAVTDFVMETFKNANAISETLRN